MKIQTIPLNRIHQHEAIDANNLMEVKAKIQKTQIFKEPIIVDKQSLVILDGHHRFNSCMELGLKAIPCILVDYMHDHSIRVISRRDSIEISKEAVIQMGLSNNVFPKKTTKHFIPMRIKNIAIPIDSLRIEPHDNIPILRGKKIDT